MKEIDSMTADELRVEVAKRKGWTDLRGGVNGGWCGTSPRWKVTYTMVPWFSGNIEAAWEMLNELPSTAYFEVQRIHVLDSQVEFTCKIRHGTECCESTSETAPMAMCRAFLKYAKDHECVLSKAF